MKILKLIITLLFSVPCYAMNLVATVNDIPISQLDVDNTAKLLQLQQGEQDNSTSQRSVKKEALENIINTILKKQKAKELGISLPAQEIDNAIAHLEQQNQMPPGALLKMLKEQNIPEKTLRNQMEADLLWLNYLRTQSQYVAVPKTSVEKRIKLMNDELKQRGITDNSVTLWELAQGVFSEDVDPSATLQSKTCEAFLDHIAIGPYPESAQSGWVDPHSLPAELYALLSDVAVGNTLGPLRTPQGMLLFMKCNVKSQRVVPTFDELKNQMEMEQMEMLSNKLLALERRQAIIEYK